jgi:heme exporter protein CcmD
MNGDYSFYIITAYTVCFVVLGGITLSTILAWKKTK